MGTIHAKPSDALFTKTQRRVLGLLFGNPDRSFYANEIVRFAGAGIGAVQRELERLEAAQLINSTKLGNQKHYRVNHQSPIFSELTELVRKALVAADRKTVPRAGTASAGAARRSGAAIRSTARGKVAIPYVRIRELCRRYHVKKLSLFGSAARGELKPDSDIDLMVEFEPGQARSLWDSPGIEEEFSALFGKRRVDLVPPAILRNPFRRKTIMPDLKILYEAE